MIQGKRLFYLTFWGHFPKKILEFMCNCVVVTIKPNYERSSKTNSVYLLISNITFFGCILESMLGPLVLALRVTSIKYKFDFI